MKKKSIKDIKKERDKKALKRYIERESKMTDEEKKERDEEIYQACNQPSGEEDEERVDEQECNVDRLRRELGGFIHRTSHVVYYGFLELRISKLKSKKMNKDDRGYLRLLKYSRDESIKRIRQLNEAD
jgi:hypothetical protein